ncbi:uncharacterized protein LOC133733746 isoform X2 [Rosa rugosa]|uniref:uncharacterized protein LOC133733746 isoform X2 n=1 Tax=Rosa rugosa TaxID=74645 RepID=UPI002B4090CA|nr:uncharacterized protein LOC133733746 isoform X2 [Rosa rugosa]
MEFFDFTNAATCKAVTNNPSPACLRAPPPAFQAPAATTELRVGDLEHSRVPNTEHNVQGCNQQPAYRSIQCEADVYLFDGCITPWKVPNGKDLLFVRPDAVFDGKKLISISETL